MLLAEGAFREGSGHFARTKIPYGTMTEQPPANKLREEGAVGSTGRCAGADW